MKSVEQIASLAVAIYVDYCRRGFSHDIAREKAIAEVSECAEDVELNKTWNSRQPVSTDAL